VRPVCTGGGNARPVCTGGPQRGAGHLKVHRGVRDDLVGRGGAGGGEGHVDALRGRGAPGQYQERDVTRLISTRRGT
jgi:hypothetical protein